MIDLKKVSGLKTSEPAHNIEDARVIADKKRKKIPAWIKGIAMSTDPDLSAADISPAFVVFST